jgi:chromate reductase, NAD(P)H dehydrogenase (quinone)
MSFHIVAMSGSLRKKSTNTAALRAAQELAPEGVTIEIIEIGDLPLYNEDLRHEGSFPEAVVRVREKVRAADAVLFACPEYNYAVTPALKNVVDWCSRAPNQPFDWKACGILGVAGGAAGTARAQTSLRGSLLSLNAFAVNQPQVMIGLAQTKFDADGKLTDQAARDFLKQHLEQLVKLAKKLKS